MVEQLPCLALLLVGYLIELEAIVEAWRAGAADDAITARGR